MAWIIYLFGSGLAFFIGIGLVLASVFFTSVQRPKWLARSSTLLAICGLVLIALSATPLPGWLYGVAGTISLAWLIVENARPGQAALRRRPLRWSMAAVWLGALTIELPYHFGPSLEITNRPKLHIIGDSVTAGMGERNLQTWPKLLAGTHGIDIQDLSRMGATAASAYAQAEQLPETGGLVLIEIGGNDVLGSTSTAKFKIDLERLLKRVCAKDRVVLMFELPLPPFQNDFGRIQRRLAAQYDVKLIPKRVFVSVLTSGAATVDSIHLAKSGHELMAQVVWELIQSAYRQ